MRLLRRLRVSGMCGAVPVWMRPPPPPFCLPGQCVCPLCRCGPRRGPASLVVLWGELRCNGTARLLPAASAPCTAAPPESCLELDRIVFEIVFELCSKRFPGLAGPGVRREGAHARLPLIKGSAASPPESARRK